MQDFTLTHNWSDWDSKIRMPPLEPTPLHSFFEADDKGPYKQVRYQGNSKPFTNLATSINDQIMSGKKFEAVVTEVEQAKSKLAVMNLSKKRDLMNKARAKAKSTLAAKKQKREVRATLS